MKSLYSLLPLLILLFPLYGCSIMGEELPEHILAQVNQEQITVNEFDREFKELMLESGRDTKGKNHRSLKQAYLDLVIERKILVQEARRLGIGVTPEELNQAILEVKKDYPGNEFGEKLSITGITLEEWKGRLEERILAEKMIRSVHYDKGSISEKEALHYYETHRSSFQLNQKVKARQIVVADEEEAKRILKRLKDGENFEKLAEKKSMGPEGVKGGDLGYFSRGEKPPEFDHVFSMEVGALSEVVRSPYGYHLFKLEEKIEPRQIPFEEAKSGILQEFGQKRREEEYQKWLKGMKKKAKVRINKKWLRS